MTQTASSSVPLDIIIPVALELDWPTVQTITRDIREQHRSYGFTRFALACPGAGWRTKGLPPESYYRERATMFREIKDALAPEGIDLGWWITLTVKSGPDPRWNRMIRIDGSQTPMASCPLNQQFRNTFAHHAAIFAKIAHPSFIVTEDDYSIGAAAGPCGCFCQNHLNAFTERTGKVYTREQLKAVFEQDAPETIPLRKQWKQLMRDTLVGFAETLRHEIDLETPEIPMGTMQSGSWDSDGDATEAVTRAMAGPNHTPFSRLYGTFYGGESILEIPRQMFHPLQSKQHIGPNFRFYHESDTFPHTRFFTSGASMRVIMSTAYAYGFDGSTFQTQQLLDNPNEEHAYGAMATEERPRFQAIHDAAKLCQVRGVRAFYDTFRREPASWVPCLAQFGIPHTSLDAPVAALSGNQPDSLTDDELTALLSRGLFLDGDAAAALCRRGFGPLIGVNVKDTPVKGIEKFDLGAREIIEPGFATDSIGRDMHRGDFYAPHGNGVMHDLIPCQPACEVMTRVVSFQHVPETVGMTRFINRLGGHIVVLGQGVTENYSSSLLNYRRQALFQEALLWCGDDVAFARGNPRIFVVMDEAEHHETAGFFGMLLLSNLCPDPVSDLSIHLPPRWRACTDWQMLSSNGHWVPCPCTRTDDGIILNTALAYARPEALLAR